ncbi:hypothetical protein OAP76_00685 [Alphaproteobacteria bacterium]|nr:hypothetical protein [Alphaproteobacteria bacterium]
MSWWKRYTAGGTGNTSSSSSSSSSSNQGDDNKGNSSSSSFGNSFTGNKGNPSEAGGSTVVNNNNDYNTDNTKSVPKQNNPYLYGGTTSEDLADVGFTGVGNPSTEKRQETSGYNPNDNEGGTLTDTTSEGVTTITNATGSNPVETFTPADNTNNNEAETKTEGEDNFFNTLFDDENTTGLPDDAKKNTTMEEKRALVLKFKAQSGYDQLPTSLRNQADEIIARINAGEYFGSDFANMQGTTQSGNEILAANNKSVADINQKDALALFTIATQNKNAGTAREAGFSATAEALLKSYVDSLSPADKAAFKEEAKKLQGNFRDPRNELVNMYTQPALLRRLTGLSTLNENQLDYDRFVSESQRVRDSRSDNNTGQVNTFTSSQMGTDTTDQGETSGYGTLIGSDTATGDFIDNDGDGVDDRYQSGPNQPYEGPDLDPNKTTTPDPDVTTANANPSSFGNTALSGVYDMIPVKNRFTGKIEYIRRPVTSNTGTRNFGSIYI